MFTLNADGTYTYDGKDARTPHALVATTAYLGQLQRGGRSMVLKGNVFSVEPLGITNVMAGQGARHPHGVLIEHPTAQPGDILPDHEVAAGITTAAAKQAAVAAYRAAEAAKPKPPPGPTLEERVAALEAKIAKPAT